MPPSPPSTTSPARKIANTFRGRGWWLGSNSTSTSGGNAFAKDDRPRSKTVTGATPGGFVRYPPPSVRRLRLRPRRPSPAAGLPHGGKRGMPSSGAAAGDPENKGIKAFAVTSRRRDAIMKRTPLCGRSTHAGLPSWASCDNSACDPGNDVAGKTAVVEKSPACESPAGVPEQQAPAAREQQAPAAREQQAPAATEQEAPAATEQEVPAAREQQAPAATEQQATAATEQQAPADTSPVRGGGRGHYSGPGPSKTAGLSAPTPSHSPTIITAVVPTARKVEHGELTTPGAGQERLCSRRSSNSSLATAPSTAALRGGAHAAAKCAAETAHNSPELGQGKAHRSPRRPTGPTGNAISGSRPRGNASSRRRGVGCGRSAEVRSAENWRRRHRNPWHTPLLVRCMRRPEPRAAQP